MASSSIFISANEARQNPIRETVIHDEARIIENAVLNAVRNGLYQATVSSGTPMTSQGYTTVTVQSVDLVNDQIFVPNHPFKTGDLVSAASTEVLPGPLTSTSYYAVIYVDSNYIKLAASVSDAFESRPIAIDFTVGVIEALLTNPGAGYTTTPVVSIEPSPTGDNATAIANLASYGGISSVTLSSSGSNYTDVPSVVFQEQGGGASVNVVQYSAVAVNVAVAGSDYRIGDVLTVVGGTGTATTATVSSVTNTGGVATVVLGNPGLYTVLPNLSSVATTSIPAGGTGCQLNLIMGIGGLAINTNLPGGSNGTGYIAPPVVTIIGGGGTGAEAEAVVSAGRVIRFNMLHRGSGYISQPTITISSGTGTIATAVLVPTSVGNLTLTNNGGNTYNLTPSVTIDPIGQGAVAGVVTMKIVSAVMTSSGSGYLAGETLLVVGGSGNENASILITKVGSFGEIFDYSLVTSGSYMSLPVLPNNAVIGGSGRSASFTLTAGVNTITVGNGGIGYAVPPHVIITSTDGNGSGASAKSILTLDELSDIQVTSSGTGYTSVPMVTVTSGSGATATAKLTPTGVWQLIPINPGSGYTAEATSLEIIGDGNGVQYTLSLGPVGTIDSITVTNSGSGFTEPPTIRVVGDGIGATVISTLLATSVESLTITNSGSNYTCPPAVTIDGNATAISRLTPTSVSRVDMIAVGTNWTSLPTIYFAPGQNQTGVPVAPSAIANIGYSLKNVSITYAGSGYQAAPLVTITPPGGYGTPATAVSYIGAGTGTITISSYADSRDYYKVWKGQTPSNELFVRPYKDRMDTVIEYFKSLGYDISRQTNPNTGNTIQWLIMW